ncbi:MAG TPA: potassium-transporting ATPase subunit KdpC [Solirubrobacteraceae bacterium]|jgi:K+-transporting ATPase ATPase C chain
MRRDIVTSVIGIVVFTILLGVVYPLVITGVSQVVFPGNANGQQIHVNGKLLGSKLIGQSFAGNSRYFQSRPSATEGGAYNAAASTFSNRGPNDKATAEADAENLKTYLELNGPYDPGLTTAQVPVDAVNTSGSNLDPEISEANARIQAHRVAAKRGLTLATVNGLIDKYTSGRGLGFSGEPGVNVLELNLALGRAH